MKMALTKGKCTLVDSSDFKQKRLDKHGWCATERSEKQGKFYAVANIGGDHVYLHRHILGVEPGRKVAVDHINGDTLDNRRTNLRIATTSQNGANRKSLNKNNTSGYRGVSWSKSNKYWQASITILNKRVHLGFYKSKIAAAKAYDRAALDAFGEFATLNFPSRKTALVS